MAPVLLAALAASCARPNEGSAEEPAPLPPRAGRFGSLRDFVLIDASASEPTGRPRHLLIDRFEVTRGEWREFAATSAGRSVDAIDAALAGEDALPVGRVSLRQARAFARWRFARLPTSEEWMAAATGEDRFRYPWGNFPSAARANTAELGYGEPTLAGTFESGRRARGQPYDLVGNVSEWTESVSASFWGRPLRGDLVADGPVFADGASMPLPFEDGRASVMARLGLSLWEIAPGLVAPTVVVAARSEVVPRDVVGADFQSRMFVRKERERLRDLVEPVLAGDRRLRTGLRLLTTPRELLRALALADVAPTPGDWLQLRRFVARDGHRAVLKEAWPEALAGIDRSRLGPLAAELGRLLE